MSSREKFQLTIKKELETESLEDTQLSTNDLEQGWKTSQIHGAFALPPLSPH